MGQYVMAAMVVALGVAAAGMVGDAYAEAVYLDVTVSVVDLDRRSYTLDSDILIYMFNITNNGGVEFVSSSNIQLVSYETGEYISYTSDDYRELDIEDDICPFYLDNPDINPRLTKSWILCYEVPAAYEPEFLHINTINYQIHVIQFDSDQYDQCVDVYSDHLCADYTLDGNAVQTNSDASSSLGFDDGAITDDDSNNITYAVTNDPVYSGVRSWLIANPLYVGYDNIMFDECGQPNAFYQPDSQSIIMCYELVVELAEIFRGSDGWDTADGVFNALQWVLMHEVGHAVIDEYDLPITGSEEDAADQFATLESLASDDDRLGTDPVAAMAYVYRSASYDSAKSWSVHSFDSQRYYNLLCLLYGSDPDGPYSRELERLLPESRLVGCPAEAERITMSWQQLLSDAGVGESNRVASITTVRNPIGTSVPGCEETDECFIPRVVVVEVGGTVVWINEDAAAHTITSGVLADGGPDGVFDSGLFAPGTKFSHTFDNIGEYPYFCMVHPWQFGLVIVQNP